MVAAITIPLLYRAVSLQVAPVHHVAMQRALAWALLSAQDSTKAINLTLSAVGDRVTAVYAGRAVVSTLSPQPIQLRQLSAAPATHATCYDVVFLSVTGVGGGHSPNLTVNITLVRVCFKP